MIGLPLKIRLRRAFFIALVLIGWAPFKIAWEQNIARQQDLLRYRGVAMTRQLRDELTQGLTIGVLAGMRSIVADFVWLDVTVAWEDEQWFKMDSLINLCTSLQPRSVVFWDYGGWQLAWNVSIAAEWDASLQANPLRRMHDSRFWIDKGLDVLKRGIANNPQSYQLWERTGQCYYQRLKDYDNAAYYYYQASLEPGAPVYLERFRAYMYEDAHDDPNAYMAWKELWLRLTPAQREEKQHWKEKIESHIRDLENRLKVPPEKRVFPK
jgi:tetratricopeptide (TPR) repeat protein